MQVMIMTQNCFFFSFLPLSPFCIVCYTYRPIARDKQKETNFVELMKRKKNNMQSIDNNMLFIRQAQRLTTRTRWIKCFSILSYFLSVSLHFMILNAVVNATILRNTFFLYL